MPRVTHGMTGTPEYKAWQMMHQRCSNPKAQAFDNYGGRGIVVAMRWSSFERFIEDMGPRPSSRHTLERIDNDAGYSKRNCRWATYKENESNRRNSHKLTFRGETLTVTQWAERLGISDTTLFTRLKKGFGVTRAITQPLQKQRHLTSRR
jgi:AraC-like DNA-binding protein